MFYFLSIEVFFSCFRDIKLFITRNRHYVSDKEYNDMRINQGVLTQETKENRSERGKRTPVGNIIIMIIAC